MNSRIKALKSIGLVCFVGAIPIVVGYVSRSFFNPQDYSSLSYSIVTDSGTRLASLFERAPIGPAAATRVPSGAFADCSASQSANLVSRVLKLFQLQSVHAVECTANPCGSAYMQYVQQWCGGDCGSETYSDVMGGGEYPWIGWRNPGDKVCPANDSSGGCVCRVATCVT